MKTLKGFNKIQSKNRIMGLEFLDLLILLVIYLVVFVFSNNLLVNLAVIVSFYFFLSLYKKGKPAHWASSVIRFLLRPRKFPSRNETKKDIFQ